MAKQTTFPTRPTPHSQLQQQINTVWSMMLWLLNSIIDPLSSSVGTPGTAGNATITAGNVSVTVTHGLGTLSYAVVITPVGNPGSYWGSAAYWISGKNTTQFTINIPIAAGSNLNFDWHAKAV